MNSSPHDASRGQAGRDVVFQIGARILNLAIGVGVTVLLARALQYADDPIASSNSQSMTEQVENALHTLAHRQLERRQRELRTLIAEADRRGGRGGESGEMAP